MPDLSTTRHSFEDFIRDHGFPCVGAKAALAHDALTYYIAGDICARNHDAAITRNIQDFAGALDPDSLYYSFIVLFPLSPPLSEDAFEAALWQRLQSFHDIDRHDYGWAPGVAQDPEAPDFSLSLGGEAFYIVGLHPGASRAARRFHCPALVFNAHRQFEQLRADGLYDGMKDKIIRRDIAAHGSANPMLAAHGEVSEARQYSGRAVPDAWQCPFHPHQGPKDAPH